MRKSHVIFSCLLFAVAACGQQAGVQTFHIQPVKPVPQLREEALKASPPPETGKKPSNLVEVNKLDPSIKLDIRYASNNNFMGTAFYEEPRAFLQKPVAEALVGVNRKLKPQGYGLLIHDAYRPWYVTKMFWDGTPADKHMYVADPQTGSRHNRGCAVDISLYDIKTGKEVEMPSGYDEMSDRSHANYNGGTPEQRRRRGLLRSAMTVAGFNVNPNEWWHFDFNGCDRYPIMNTPFAQLVR